MSCLCVIGKLVAYLMVLLCLCVMGKSVAFCFSLLSVCYWKVACLFHGVFCLFVMGKLVVNLIGVALWPGSMCAIGKSVAHLIRFAACVLWKSRLLI